MENLLMAFLASDLHVTCYIGYQSQNHVSVQRIERDLGHVYLSWEIGYNSNSTVYSHITNFSIIKYEGQGIHADLIDVNFEAEGLH